MELWIESRFIYRFKDLKNHFYLVFEKKDEKNPTDLKLIFR